MQRPLDVRRHIGVVIQEQAAELLLSVRDNLLTFARFHRRTGPAVRARADAVIQQFGLEELADKKVQDLSGGARRRVQVAKIFLVIARGDLHHLKTLVDRLYEVTLAFEQLPAALNDLLGGFRPLELSTQHNTVQMKLREDEARVLELVATLARHGRLLRIEINSASLEDIFVELTHRSGA